VRIAWLAAIAGLLFTLLGACTPSAPNLATPEAVPGGVPLTAEHVLAPGDEFELRFAFYPDLNDRVIVGPDGRLSLQLVNSVAVGGLTVSDATTLINQRYAKVIRDPQASLTLRRLAAPRAVPIPTRSSSCGGRRTTRSIIIRSPLATMPGPVFPPRILC
jgi:hypothetical protein